jgi:hypothetical protein
VNGDQRARTPAFKAVKKTCLPETQDADLEKLIRAADDVAWMCARILRPVGRLFQAKTQQRFEVLIRT